MLEIRLLGQFALHKSDVVVDLPSRPAQSLLAYLVLNRGVKHRREMLAGMLWPESSEGNARNNLRHALWRLRRSLGETYLEADKITVQFDFESEYWLDVEAFKSSSNLQLSTNDRLDALDQYRGDLLPGFYDEWVQIEREQLRSTFDQEVEKILKQLEAEERWDDVIEWCERWIALGQIPEAAYRSLMLAHAFRGDQAGIATDYKRLKRDLKELLDVEPSEETHDLYLKLVGGGLPKVTIAAPLREQRVLVRPKVPLFLDSVQRPRSDIDESFVGRTEELGWLDRWLTQSTDQNGQFCFITGEAGRGKSTLLSQFSQKAQEKYETLIVASGTCSVYTGIGDPFLPFREILEMLTGDFDRSWLAGSVQLEHAERLWEQFPQMLEALIDHGPNLIGSFVSAPKLARHAAARLSPNDEGIGQIQAIQSRNESMSAGSSPHRNRLFEEYTEVLRIIASKRPLLILLDDLHWIDLSSASLLFHLARRLSGTSIMIVGAYRPEDIVPLRDGQPHPMESLLNEFRRLQGDVWLDLDKSSYGGSMQFVSEMIDTEPNQLSEPFRMRLTETTNGHPLFTRELLTEMQQRGDLIRNDDGNWVEGASLDWEVLPAKVEAVIERRLGRIDDDLREVLDVASVEGETFTTEVVADVLGRDKRDLARRISVELQQDHRMVREVGSVEVNGARLARYQFRHRLIQAYLYRRQSQGERVYLHDLVGRSLEQRFGEQTQDIAVQLANHFVIADVIGKAVRYLSEAGSRALEVSANEEAISHLELANQMAQSKEFILKQDSPVEDDDTLSRLERIQLERMLGEAYLRLGDLRTSLAHLQNSLRYAGKPVPTTNLGLYTSTFVQIVRQIFHRILPARVIRSTGDTRMRFQEAAYIYKVLPDIYLPLNETLRALYAVMRSLNLAERVGVSPELARAYADMAVATPLLRLHRMAERYRLLSEQTANLLEQPQATAYVKLLTGIYFSGEGRWEEGREALIEANQIHDQIGDWYRLEIGLVMLSSNNKFQGKLDLSDALYEELLEVSRRSGSVLHEVWALNGLAGNRIRMGGKDHLDQADEWLAESMDLMAKMSFYHEEAGAKGLLGISALMDKEFESAVEYGSSALEYIAQSPPNFFTLLDTISNAAHIFLETWDLQMSEGEPASDVHIKLAVASLGYMREYARIFPIGSSRLNILQGQFEWLSQRQTVAMKHWQRGLQLAVAHQMPFEEGLAHFFLGLIDPHSRSSDQHLQSAEEIFSEFHAGYFESRAKQLRSTQKALA